MIVQRSPFLTQSVPLTPRRRSLRRVRITSPSLAWFPSASATSGPGAPSRRVLRARCSGRRRGRGWGRASGSRAGGSVGFQAARTSSAAGDVADVDAIVVEVEPERRVSPSRRAREAVASMGSSNRTTSREAARRGWRCRGVRRRRRSRRAVGRRRSAAPAPRSRRTWRRVEGGGVGHPGLVDHDQRAPADVARPARGRSCVAARPQVSLARVSAWTPVCVGE